MRCPNCAAPIRLHVETFLIQSDTSGSTEFNGTLVPTDKLKEMQERLARYEIVEKAAKELNERLRTQLAAAEEALKYYASTHTWMPTTHEGTHDGTGLEDFQTIKIVPGEIRQIAGKKARAYFDKHGDKP